MSGRNDNIPTASELIIAADKLVEEILLEEGSGPTNDPPFLGDATHGALTAYLALRARAVAPRTGKGLAWRTTERDEFGENRTMIVIADDGEDES